MSALSENTRDRARANYKTTRTPSHRLPLLFFVSFVFIFVSSSATIVAASSSYESGLLEKWKGTKEYAKAEKASESARGTRSIVVKRRRRKGEDDDDF